MMRAAVSAAPMIRGLTAVRQPTGIDTTGATRQIEKDA